MLKAILFRRATVPSAVLLLFGHVFVWKPWNGCRASKQTQGNRADWDPTTPANTDIHTNPDWPIQPSLYPRKRASFRFGPRLSGKFPRSLAGRDSCGAIYASFCAWTLRLAAQQWDCKPIGQKLSICDMFFN